MLSLVFYIFRSDHVNRSVADYPPQTYPQCAFKGSGLATVFAAMFLFLKYRDNPEQGIIAAVNALGSDTDGQTCTLHARKAIQTGVLSEPEDLSSAIEHNPDVIAALSVAR
jgi:ADP-ribosylglycohydrolase